jgi:hypothetical protein
MKAALCILSPTLLRIIFDSGLGMGDYVLSISLGS